MNPNISVGSVNRRFFNQYYYKLEIHVTGSSFLRHPDEPIDQQIATRNRMVNVNYGGSWRRGFQSPNLEEIRLLERIKLFKAKYEDQLKFRIEEPNLQVYAEDEDILYKFAQAICDADNSHLTTISRPKTDKILSLLKQGYTVTKKDMEYPFKVMVREGRYSKDIKEQLLKYLQGIGDDQAYLPPHFVESMSKTYESVWNIYFYVRDRSLLTMISLIHPGFVRTVEEFQQVDK